MGVVAMKLFFQMVHVLLVDYSSHFLMLHKQFVLN